MLINFTVPLLHAGSVFAIKYEVGIKPNISKVSVNVKYFEQNEYFTLAIVSSYHRVFINTISIFNSCVYDVDISLRRSHNLMFSEKY